MCKGYIDGDRCPATCRSVFCWFHLKVHVILYAELNNYWSFRRPRMIEVGAWAKNKLLHWNPQNIKERECMLPLSHLSGSVGVLQHCPTQVLLLHHLVELL